MRGLSIFTCTLLLLFNSCSSDPAKKLAQKECSCFHEAIKSAKKLVNYRMKNHEEVSDMMDSLAKEGYDPDELSDSERKIYDKLLKLEEDYLNDYDDGSSCFSDFLDDNERYTVVRNMTDYHLAKNCENVEYLSIGTMVAD